MTPADHRRKAEHNERFIDTVFDDYVANPSPFVDWIMTAIFYVAVHKVDEYLASLPDPQHPIEHRDRRRFVQTLPDLRVVNSEYRWLEDRSRESRYQSSEFNPINVRSWRTNKLGKIKTHIDRRLQQLTNQ